MQAFPVRVTIMLAPQRGECNLKNLAVASARVVVAAMGGEPVGALAADVSPVGVLAVRNGARSFPF